MNGPALVALLDATLDRLAAAQEELRDLDAALGDGDLGITVAKGAAAVRGALAGLAEPTPGSVLKAAGAAFASANPSTMAALVGGGLLAAAKALGEDAELDRATCSTAAHAAADRIATRGGAQRGDKTLLDALLPSLDVLDAAGEADARTVLDDMVHAAEKGVRDTTELVSQRGRAAWVGERSAGHPDPGATAYLRLLQALAASWPRP